MSACRAAGDAEDHGATAAGGDGNPAEASSGCTGDQGGRCGANAGASHTSASGAHRSQRVTESAATQRGGVAVGKSESYDRRSAGLNRGRTEGLRDGRGSERG